MSKKNQSSEKAPLKNWRNYEHKKGYEDYEGQVSRTVPDQAYTVQEIFSKFRAGIRLNIEREPYYSDTDNFDHPDASEMIDIVDYHEAAKAVRETLKQDQGTSRKNDAPPQAAKPAEPPTGEAAFQAANVP